jgi:hypothetical protein
MLTCFRKCTDLLWFCPPLWQSSFELSFPGSDLLQVLKALLALMKQDRYSCLYLNIHPEGPHIPPLVCRLVMMVHLTDDRNLPVLVQLLALGRRGFVGYS